VAYFLTAFYAPAGKKRKPKNGHFPLFHTFWGTNVVQVGNLCFGSASFSGAEFRLGPFFLDVAESLPKRVEPERVLS